MKIGRRELVKKGLVALGAAGLLRHGYGRAEKVRLGFIPLTDCAPLVVAQELGFFRKHGVAVELYKEASWATTRDHLLSGEVAGAHTLFGLPLSVYTGLGGPAGRVIRIALVLNENGQAITLAQRTFAGRVGFKDPEGVGRLVRERAQAGRPLTFAVTFPGGTHDLWLRYFLAAGGVDPTEEVRLTVVPPPQMVANMAVGNMDGFCVGEPWNEVAARQGIGFTGVASQDIWKHHPEKVLAFNAGFLEAYPEKARAILRGVLEAQRWLEEPGNLPKAARLLGQRAYVGADPQAIAARLAGVYELGGGLGRRVYREDRMRFFRGGQTPFPRKAHAIWFLAQYRRWGMLKAPPDYRGLAETLLAQDLYRLAAQELGIPAPEERMEPLTGFMDGVSFDPKDPEAALKGYRVKRV